MSEVLDTVPRTLNGYPVLHRQAHKNGYWTVLLQTNENSYVVATWWPELGTTWQWGHYSNDYAEAMDDFAEVQHRNRKRGNA
jgi:hypothetical protein